MKNQYRLLHFCFAGALLLPCVAPTAAKPDRTGPIRRLECVVVDKASIVARTETQEGYFGLANVGHQVGSGNHMVLVMRAFEDPGPIDSQSFWKATLEFPAMPLFRAPGQTEAVSVLSSYYTEGSSGWVANGEYTWAENAFSRFYVTRTKYGDEVSLQATISATHADSGETRRVEVAWTCPVTALTVRQLDPWQGRIGTAWESFAPNKPSWFGK